MEFVYDEWKNFVEYSIKTIRSSFRVGQLLVTILNNHWLLHDLRAEKKFAHFLAMKKFLIASH